MSRKSVKFKVSGCFAALCASLILASSSAFANSILSEIEIKNTPSEYNITLQLNDEADIKKKVLSDSSILLTLENVFQAHNVPVLYEGDRSVDNIIVKDKKNNVEILVQGENATKSNIFVKEMNTGLLKQIYSGNNKKSLFGNGFYLLDAKFSSIIILGLIFMFTMFAFVRPKNEGNKISSYKKTNSQDTSKVSTIRNHLMQKRAKTAPYIHYGAAGYSSIPEDFITTNSYTEEKTRKFG